MKNTITISYIFIIFLSCIGLSSCKKDDNKSIQINSIWNHEQNIESIRIRSTYFNRWIRINGQGFEGLQKIYLNGREVTFNPVLVTNNNIIVNVPRIPVGTAVGDPEHLNTIHIITKGGQTIYKDFIFKDPNKIPTINSITNAMPYPGDEIAILGVNLSNTTKVYFPGDIEAEIIAATDTRVRLKVPNNINREVSGSIKLIVDGDEFLTPPYMFYQNGIFFKTFTEVDRTGLAANSNDLIINTPAGIATATGIAVNNPEAVLAIPRVPTNLAVVANATWAGFFRFWPAAAFQQVIDNPLNGISASSSLQDLAIQFELYMNQPWKSGYISLAINKDAGGSTTGAYRCNIYGGTTAEPINFNGKWLTVTVPFSRFNNLALGSLGDYINTLKGNNYQSLIGFSNSNPDNNISTPQAVSNFQMFIANVRLVPTK